MTATDEFLVNASAYAASFGLSHMAKEPARRTAIVTCMDARMNVYEIFGMSAGEANVIRNAGGVVTEDVIRSLAISQRLLGTTEVVLVHHTDCGLLGFSAQAFRDRVETDSGFRPQWPAEGFDDVDDDVRRSMARVEASPFLPAKEHVRGFVYDVTEGTLREVRR